MKLTCRWCGIVFIGPARWTRHDAHTWTHPDLVASLGLDPEVWCV